MPCLSCVFLSWQEPMWDSTNNQIVHSKFFLGHSPGGRLWIYTLASGLLSCLWWKGSIATYPVPEVLCICCSKSATAIAEATTWNLEQSAVNLLVLFGFCRSQTGENRNMMGTINYQVFILSAIPPGAMLLCMICYPIWGLGKQFRGVLAIMQSIVLYHRPRNCKGVVALPCHLTTLKVSYKTMKTRAGLNCC